MKNNIILIIFVVLLLLGGWYFLLPKDEHDHEHPHDHDHETHKLEAKEPVRTDGTFSIVTSFYPLAFALETLTEGVAEVTNIGEGQDPHDVQLSTTDVLTMQRSDLVVLQGTDLEPWGDDVTKQLQRDGVPVVLATHDLELRESRHYEHDDDHSDEDTHDGEEHGHNHGAYDPHTWLDPVLFSQTVAELVEALETLDPENTELYEERGKALRAELTTLDNEYGERLSACILNEVITSHDAFGYVGERYNFEIHTIAGISTQDVPSAQTLAELKKEAEEGVGAILLEESSVTAYGETLANETGLLTLSINPIAYIVPTGEDYLTIMRSNLEIFATALQCNE